MKSVSLQGNWVDLVILMTLLFFAFGALRRHFWLLLADFFAFLISLTVSLKFYPFASEFLKTNFSLSNSFANALGFLLSASVTEFILAYAFILTAKKIPNKFWKFPGRKLLALLPAIGEGLILISFILSLSLALPILPSIKSDISDSKIGGFIVNKTSGFEAKLSDVFGGVVEDTLTYLIVKPGSEESIPLNIESRELAIDEKSEREMFDLVNQERIKRELSGLVWNTDLNLIARDYAKDMWERKYFSHYSPEGIDVSGRLEEKGIVYVFAGENLALAPTILIAHNGLMNSEGHRENILDSHFNEVGIGVVDNGIFGKIFVQVFKD